MSAIFRNQFAYDNACEDDNQLSEAEVEKINDRAEREFFNDVQNFGDWQGLCAGAETLLQNWLSSTLDNDVSGIQDTSIAILESLRRYYSARIAAKQNQARQNELNRQNARRLR